MGFTVEIKFEIGFGFQLSLIFSRLGLNFAGGQCGNGWSHGLNRLGLG